MGDFFQNGTAASVNRSVRLFQRILGKLQICISTFVQSYVPSMQACKRRYRKLVSLVVWCLARKVLGESEWEQRKLCGSYACKLTEILGEC